MSRRLSRAAPQRTCAFSAATLTAGGGWSDPHPWVGPRAREPLAVGGQLELALAFAAAKVRDAHLERIAEGVGAPAAAADERGRELVQLEVIAREAPRRDEALEDIAEAGEQARR